MSIATNGAQGQDLGAAARVAVGLAPSFRRDAQFFIVQSFANRERFARDALQSPYRGCTVYLPLELVTVVHARRRKEVERAFLPCYLFVLDEGQSLSVMRSAPGVSHVVKCGDRFAMIAQKFIDRIKAREIEGTSPDGKRTERYVDLDAKWVAPDVDFAPGEGLRVTDGPFASFDAVFSQWTARHDRAKVVVQIFGRENEVELEPWQFEKR